MSNVKPHSIAIATVTYNISQEKRRPVYILTFTNEQITVFRITSKFESKSSFIKSHYFEILDWEEAGLRKPSWIDTMSTIILDMNAITIHSIGSLTPHDEKRLLSWLENTDHVRYIHTQKQSD